MKEDKMNLKIKALLLVCLLLMTLTFVTGCADDRTPYEINDAESYNVSVKYDANGGIFTTNTSIIVDSYNLSEVKTGTDGKAEIALLSPDSSYRGNDAFTAINNGYFLAGWYAGRTETTDSAGNTVYTYSDPWNFAEDRLTVDANGTYSSAEPVLTLYAAWIPMFEIEFVDLGTGETMGSYTFDPTQGTEILVPVQDEESGTVKLYQFPEKSGWTYTAAYYDAQGTDPIETATVEHTGVIDYATGTAENASMKVYVDWMEGEWYHIYNVEQFLDNASVNGSYVIHADLDFTDEIWPTSLMHGNFAGTIQGNGHTFSNIDVTQTNNSKVNAGLFGQLTETADISGLTFENVTFTIQSGTRVAGASFGLLAGTISDSARLEDVKITAGKLQIDSGSYFGVDDYAIGLLCGMGNDHGVDYAGITCEAVGQNPESLLITVDGSEVTLEFVSE